MFTCWLCTAVDLTDESQIKYAQGSLDALILTGS